MTLKLMPTSYTKETFGQTLPSERCKLQQSLIVSCRQCWGSHSSYLSPLPSLSGRELHEFPGALQGCSREVKGGGGCRRAGSQGLLCGCSAAPLLPLLGWLGALCHCAPSWGLLPSTPCENTAFLPVWHTWKDRQGKALPHFAPSYGNTSILVNRAILNFL